MDRKEQIQLLEKLASDMASGAKSIRKQIEELQEELETEAFYEGLKPFVEGEDSLWGSFPNNFTWELKWDVEIDDELEDDEDDEELALVGTPKNDVVRAALNQFKSLSQYKKHYKKNGNCYQTTLKSIKNFMNKYVWCLPFTRQLFRDKQDIIIIPCSYSRSMADGFERIEKILFLIKNLDEATIQKPVREFFFRLLDREEQFIRKYVKDFEEVVEFRKRLFSVSIP